MFKISHLIRSVRNPPILSSLCSAFIIIIMYSIVLIANGCSSQLVAKYCMNRGQIEHGHTDYAYQPTHQWYNNRIHSKSASHSTHQRYNNRSRTGYNDHATNQPSTSYGPIVSNRNRRVVLSRSDSERDHNYYKHDSHSKISIEVNNLSKKPWNNGFKRECSNLAQYLTKDSHNLVQYQLNDNIGKQLSLLVNGFSKWPEESDCKEATNKIADYVTKPDTDLSKWKPQDFSNLENGFSKWPKERKCKEAAHATVAYIATKPDTDFSKWKPQDFSNLVNGFSKWPKENKCKEAAKKIAGYIATKTNTNLCDA